MKWFITYYSERVKQDVFDLPDTLLIRYTKMVKIMEESGPNLEMPYARAMGNGLFELRLKGKEGIGRVFYCVLIRDNICMLHSIIKKKKKTHLREVRKK